MSDPSRWIEIVTRAYRLLLNLYPSGFRDHFGEEMLAVFRSRLKEKDRENLLQLLWQELRHWPGSVMQAHLRARRRQMATNRIDDQRQLTRIELLAAMLIFLLPLFSLAGLSGNSLPDWSSYVFLIVFWGSVIFALGIAIARRLPTWSLPYLGFAIMLGQVFNPILPGMITRIYPYFLKVFGARAGWPVSIRIIYAGIFEFAGLMMVLLGALLLVNLLRFLPPTRAVWERMRSDWTQLSFMLYGGQVFYIMVAFDEYRHEELWKLGIWAFLASGAWLYLRENRHINRYLALLAGTTAAFWTAALAKWVLIPFQMWPTGYPDAPTEATRWTATGNTLLTWVFMLGILNVPVLMKYLPPSPESASAGGSTPSGASLH